MNAIPASPAIIYYPSHVTQHAVIQYAYVLFSDPRFVHDLDHYPPLDHRQHSALRLGLFPDSDHEQVQSLYQNDHIHDDCPVDHQSVMLLLPQTLKLPYLFHVPS